MKADDARSLRSDLDIILHAAGLEQGPTRADLIGWAALLVGGALSFASSLLLSAHDTKWSLLSLVVLPLAFHGYQYFRSAELRERKNGKTAWVAAALALVGAGTYRGWSQSLGLHRTVAASVLLFGVGAGLLLAALGQRRRLDERLFPILLIAFAFVLPLASQTPIAIVSLAFTLAGTLGVAYCRWKLRRAASSQ